MDKKIYWKGIKIITIFLLLIPFRLPIAAGFIYALDWISTIGTADLHIGIDVLHRNILITKIAYDVILATIFVWSIEKWSREYKQGRAEFDGGYAPMWWWSFLVALSMVPYIATDIISTSEMFYNIHTHFIEDDQGVQKHICYPHNVFNDDQGDTLYVQYFNKVVQ